MKQIGKKLLVVGILAGAMGLSAHGKGEMGMHGDPEKHMERMKKHLNLTPTQETEIKKIMDASEPAKKESHDKIKKSREELHTLLEEDNLDKAKIRSKMEEISKLKLEKKMIWIDDRIAIQKLLTPEQRAKQKEHMKKHREEMKSKHEKWKKHHN